MKLANHVAVGLVFLLLSGVAYGQCGDPPADFCSMAQVIPGEPGVYHYFVDVSTATAIGETACGVPIGHSTWFQVIPEHDSKVTFSTCHQNTGYDTVVEAYSGGESSCEFMSYVTCNDDTFEAECANGCSAFGSTVSINTLAQGRYRFVVGSYNNNSIGCPLCLGVTVRVCNNDESPPTTTISSPGALGCTCGVVPIMGSAIDYDSALEWYQVDVTPVNSDQWTPIAWFEQPIEDSLLALWDTSGLTQGYYYIRLTTMNVCRQYTSTTTVVFVDGGFDSLTLRSPSNGSVVGGIVCPDGTAWDQCFAHYSVDYRPFNGAFQPVDPAHSTYFSSVITDPLAQWDTRTGIPDGSYVVRVQGSDSCGHTAAVTNDVVVDNTSPTVFITSPSSCDYLDGMVPIVGTVMDAHLASWALYVSGDGGHGWQTIGSGSSPVNGGTLGVWNAGAAEPCAYLFRLIATDQATINCNGAIHNQTEYTVSVNVGYCGDFDVDDDDDVDLVDYGEFQDSFTGP